MTRRAAGDAGRPAARQVRRRTARARPAASLAVLLGVLLGALTPVAAGGPALAAPAVDEDTAGSDTSDDTATDTRPVAVTLTRLEPRTVTPGSTVEVAGTLTNDGDDTLTDLTLRLQRGPQLSTRAELAEVIGGGEPRSVAATPFEPVPGQLEPGDSVTFSYTTTAEDLRLAEDGVYPLLVNVNGTRSGLTERIGELSTQLVVQAAPPVAPTTVAWLWPLTDRPHRDAEGAFTDDALAAELTADGRLDRALDVLEQLPDGGAAVPVTLAVDPALVEELLAMEDGYTVDGAPGQGSTAAADWLARLRALAADHTVLALPYADVDGDALQAAGLPDVLSRTLPGSAAGTAAQPGDDDASALPSPPAGAPDAAPPPEAPADGGDGGGEADAAAGAGAALLTEALGVAPRTDVAWPPGGVLRADTLATLQAGGADRLVLAADSWDDGGAVTGAGGGTAAARVPLDTPAGPVTSLVADPALAEVVADADSTPGGARVAEQRYLAELGVLATGSSGAQTVLVVPPRRVDAEPAWATAMLTDTVSQPWLAAATLDQLAAGPGTDAGSFVPADAADRAGSPLTAAALAAIAEAARIRDDVAAAVVGDPAAALAGYDAAIARAASSGWPDPDAATAAATDLLDTVGELRGAVSLVPPAEGSYSLASSDAPLVLTVANDLPFPVTVRLRLSTRGQVGFAAGDIDAVLEPSSRTTLQVPTELSQSGTFAVSATLSTPAGGTLGESVELRVSSTAYGPVTLVITIGAAALLALLFLRRLVRFVLRRRRGEARPVDPDRPVPVDAGRTGSTAASSAGAAAGAGVGAPPTDPGAPTVELPATRSRV